MSHNHVEILDKIRTEEIQEDANIESCKKSNLFYRTVYYYLGNSADDIKSHEHSTCS